MESVTFFKGMMIEVISIASFFDWEVLCSSSHYRMKILSNPCSYLDLDLKLQVSSRMLIDYKVVTSMKQTPAVGLHQQQIMLQMNVRNIQTTVDLERNTSHHNRSSRANASSNRGNSRKRYSVFWLFFFIFWKDDARILHAIKNVRLGTWERERK